MGLFHLLEHPEWSRMIFGEMCLTLVKTSAKRADFTCLGIPRSPGSLMVNCLLQ